MSVVFYFSISSFEERQRSGKSGFNLALSPNGDLIKYTEAYEDGAVPKHVQDYAYPKPSENQTAGNTFAPIMVSFNASSLKDVRVVLDETGPCNRDKWKEWGYTLPGPH